MPLLCLLLADTYIPLPGKVYTFQTKHLYLLNETSIPFEKDELMP